MPEITSTIFKNSAGKVDGSNQIRMSTSNPKFSKCFQLILNELKKFGLLNDKVFWKAI